MVFDNDITYLHIGLAAVMIVLDNRKGRILLKFLPSWNWGDEERQTTDNDKHEEQWQEDGKKGGEQEQAVLGTLPSR